MDFSKWAVVAHKDDTGLGRQASYITELLQLGHHLVVPSERLQDHPLLPGRDVFLSPEASAEVVRAGLSGLEGIIVLERHSWHAELLQIARDMGLRTVCVPNWEWFDGSNERWGLCDLFVCPSRHTLSVVRGYGFENSVYIPPAVNLCCLPFKLRSGKARLFVHNAGLVDADDRKGTRDTIQAFKMVKRQDIRLLVRIQKAVSLPEIDDRIEIEIGNLADAGELYSAGDVAIQPSKMEGVGFMVLEPLCSGLPVITTDYPPMNEYITTTELLVRKRWFRRKSFASQWIKQAHLRLPDLHDLARKIEWCADNDMASISQANRKTAESMFSPVAQQAQWIEALQAFNRRTIDQFPRR